MFENKIIGLDISDESIKFLQIDNHKSVVAGGECPVPENTIKAGEIVNTKQFIKVSRELLGKLDPLPSAVGITRPVAIVSLPEHKVWSHTFKPPEAITDDALRQYVQGEVGKIIPVEISKLATTTIQKKQFLTWIGANRELVDTYASCLSEAGFTVDFIGSNFYSIARAVLPKTLAEDNYLIIEIGRKRITLGVFAENNIAYFVQPSLVDAELLNSQLNSLSSKSDVIIHLVAEITKLQQFFKDQTNQIVTKIIITGQTPDLDRLSEAIPEVENVPVRLAEPYQYLNNTTNIDSNIPTLSMANVVGLALYGVDRTMPHMNLLSERDRKIKSWHLTQPDPTIEFISHPVTSLLAAIAKLKNRLINDGQK